MAPLADSSPRLSTDTSGENIAESLVAEGLASRREGIRANKYVCGCVPARPRRFSAVIYLAWSWLGSLAWPAHQPLSSAPGFAATAARYSDTVPFRLGLWMGTQASPLPGCRSTRAVATGCSRKPSEALGCWIVTPGVGLRCFNSRRRGDVGVFLPLILRLGGAMLVPMLCHSPVRKRSPAPACRRPRCPPSHSRGVSCFCATAINTSGTRFPCRLLLGWKLARGAS